MDLQRSRAGPIRPKRNWATRTGPWPTLPSGQGRGRRRPRGGPRPGRIRARPRPGHGLRRGRGAPAGLPGPRTGEPAPRGRWASTLFDELTALGYAGSYPSFTRALQMPRSSGGRPDICTAMRSGRSSRCRLPFVSAACHDRASAWLPTWLPHRPHCSSSSSGASESSTSTDNSST